MGNRAFQKTLFVNYLFRNENFDTRFMTASAIKQAGDFAAFFHPKTGNGVLYHIKNLQLPLTHSIS